jgi:hypothetical protein
MLYSLFLSKIFLVLKVSTKIYIANDPDLADFKFRFRSRQKSFGSGTMGRQQMVDPTLSGSMLNGQR